MNGYGNLPDFNENCEISPGYNKWLLNTIPFCMDVESTKKNSIMFTKITYCEQLNTFVLYFCESQYIKIDLRYNLIIEKYDCLINRKGISEYLKVTEFIVQLIKLQRNHDVETLLKWIKLKTNIEVIIVP